MTNTEQALELAILAFNFEMGRDPDLNENKDMATVAILAKGIEYARSGNLLTRRELDTIHDVMYDIFDKDFDNNTLLSIWSKHVPEQIKNTAKQWGADDSVVRDDLHEWAAEQPLEYLLS